MAALTYLNHCLVLIYGETEYINDVCHRFNVGNFLVSGFERENTTCKALLPISIDDISEEETRLRVILREMASTMIFEQTNMNEECDTLDLKMFLKWLNIFKQHPQTKNSNILNERNISFVLCLRQQQEAKRYSIDLIGGMRLPTETANDCALRLCRIQTAINLETHYCHLFLNNYNEDYSIRIFRISTKKEAAEIQRREAAEAEAERQKNTSCSSRKTKTISCC